ncbi:hypothetical protein Q5H92_09000 [Hymenobacter sp. M29]|uniref:Uncharacterized protein n=1 Tax=Hymenobacter mellowenesis TaxID=3063995 RepID=A0ABT9A9H5_9BACT|nr:hypothetical protein [Hymenobacter sp. M29]MDO7846493.1 hypothetical protein [Hymenobacter sp. M29]
MDFPRTFLKLLAVLLALIVGGVALFGCAVLLPNRPRARRHPTLEQARRWVEYNNEPRQRNKRYYRAYPR